MGSALKDLNITPTHEEQDISPCQLVERSEFLVLESTKISETSKRSLEVEHHQQNLTTYSLGGKGSN